jgi:glycosyltransferase involved in cell wall biosynthesis
MQCVLTGHDFGHWAVIENLIAALGLKSVFYMGRVEFSELIWLYKHCAAVLALGVHESSSLPVREGAAFGKPLIAVDIQPNIEAQEYLNLTLIDHQDPVCLTDAICHIACHDQATIMQAEENVEKVKRLDWSVVLGLYLQALEAAH